MSEMFHKRDNKTDSETTSDWFAPAVFVLMLRWFGLTSTVPYVMYCTLPNRTYEYGTRYKQMN